MPGMSVLDLGSGFGGLAQFLASEYGCRVVSYNIRGSKWSTGVNCAAGYRCVSNFAITARRRARRIGSTAWLR